MKKKLISFFILFVVGSLPDRVFSQDAPLHGDTQYRKYEKFISRYDKDNSGFLSLREWLSIDKPEHMTLDIHKQILIQQFIRFDLDCNKKITAEKMYKSIYLREKPNCLQIMPKIN